MNDTVTVGDLSSKEMGSGARKSEGKPDYGLIYSPLLLATLEVSNLRLTDLLGRFLNCLGRFQLHANRIDLEEAYNISLALLEETTESYGYSELDATCRVFTLGAEKYNAFNWMKGMPWSVCIGCIHRHILKQFAMLEELDDESGEPHIAHVICNLHMLLFYMDNFKEGNDLPASVVNFPDAEPMHVTNDTQGYFKFTRKNTEEAMNKLLQRGNKQPNQREFNPPESTIENGRYS